MIELAAAGRWPAPDDPRRRYYVGRNTTSWRAQASSRAGSAKDQWREEVFDLWRDGGNYMLTGIAPTAMGGPAHFDRIELWSQPPAPAVGR